MEIEIETEKTKEWRFKIDYHVDELHNLLKDSYTAECVIDDPFCDNEDCVLWKAVEQYKKYN